MISTNEAISLLSASAQRIHANMSEASIGGVSILKTKEYTYIDDNGFAWMSTRQLEIDSNADFIANASGNVLIAGLGIGLIIDPLLHMKNITSVTVVEANRSTIDLISPFYADEKISIINSDIFNWKTKAMYDTIYFDIWISNEPDYFEQISFLEKKFLSNLNMNGWIGSWRTP